MKYQNIDNVFMNVNVLEEAGYNSAMIGLSLNKKKDPNTMVNVANKLYKFDCGHNKFLESIKVWMEVTAPRYWWSEADTYRLTTKQSNSTMHTLVKEITSFKELDNLKQKLKLFNNNIDNKQLDVDAKVIYYYYFKINKITSPLEYEQYTKIINNLGLKYNQNQFIDWVTTNLSNRDVYFIQKNNNQLVELFENYNDIVSFIVGEMTTIALNPNLNDSERIIQLKQIMPEGFLQTRVWCVDYKSLRNIIKQRSNHRLPHWHMFIEQTLKQLQHFEFFDDILNE